MSQNLTPLSLLVTKRGIRTSAHCGTSLESVKERFHPTQESVRHWMGGRGPKRAPGTSRVLLTTPHTPARENPTTHHHDRNDHRWIQVKGTICQIIIIESRILDSIEGWYLYSYSSFWSEGSKDLEARRRRTSKGGAVDEALQCTGVNMHFLELKNTVHPQIYRGIVPQHQLYLRQSNRTAKKFTLHICQQHVS